MKKKQMANLIMVVVIVLIAAAGILGVGYIQGWFDADDGAAAVLTEVRGTVHLERSGVSYPAENDTVLRPGDIITCDPGTTALIRMGDGSIALGEQAALTVSNPGVETFRVEVACGELFVNAPATLVLEGEEILFSDATASVSVRSGARSIGVFAGSVEDASAGQIIDWVGDSRTVSELKITTLNDFTIAQIREANEYKTLCFTDAQLDALLAEREAQMQAQLNQTEPVTEPEETVPVTEAPTEAPTEEATVPKPTEGREDPKPTEGRQEPKPTQPPATDPPATEPPTEAPTEPPLTCTISIRCDTILNNMDNLDPAKAGFVPGNGVILSSKTVTFTQGETVFDVLKRVCAAYGIQLEYSWTPMYNSYYVEGINNIYEFDCGSESGWMYKVNGWFPNYGSSDYVLSSGDNIAWCFTCVGLGADLGA